MFYYSLVKQTFSQLLLLKIKQKSNEISKGGKKLPDFTNFLTITFIYVPILDANIVYKNAKISWIKI